MAHVLDWRHYNGPDQILRGASRPLDRDPRSEIGAFL